MRQQGEPPEHRLLVAQLSTSGLSHVPSELQRSPRAPVVRQQPRPTMPPQLALVMQVVATGSSQVKPELHGSLAPPVATQIPPAVPTMLQIVFRGSSQLLSWLHGWPRPPDSRQQLSIPRLPHADEPVTQRVVVGESQEWSK